MQLGDGQLSRRIITAVVGVPILLGLYYVGGWPLFFLLVGLIVIAADELGQMFDKLSVAPSRADLIFGGLTLLLGAYISTINKEYGTVGGAVVTVLLAAFAIKEMVKGTKFSPERVALALFGSIVGLFSLLGSCGPSGTVAVTDHLVLLFGPRTWCLFHRHLRQTSMAPTISRRPGGLWGAGLWCVGGWQWVCFGIWGHRFPFGAGGRYRGQIGDLVESALKRAAGVRIRVHCYRDTGSIGSVRQSYLAAPLAYLLVTVLLG